MRKPKPPAPELIKAQAEELRASLAALGKAGYRIDTEAQEASSVGAVLRKLHQELARIFGATA